MRYIYLILFLSIMGFSSFSCEGSEDDRSNDGQKPAETIKSVAGYWYACEENYIYSLYMDGEGNSLMKVYVCETDKTWKEFEYKALYTLNATGDFVYQLTAGEHLSEMAKTTYSGRCVLTGNNMSLQFDDEVMMFTKYSGAKSDLASAMEDIEDNLLVITPEEETADENFWRDEEDFRKMLVASYGAASTFVQKQVEIERLLMWNHSSKLDPYSTIVEELWSQGYLAINYLNRIIAHANVENSKYKDSALALRSFIYYNMAMLWGNIPYIDISSESDMDEWNRVPQMEAKIIYRKLLTDLQGLAVVERDVTMMTQDACEVLKKEINLSLAQAYAEQISSIEHEIFKVSYGGTEFQGNYINVYTQMYISLLNAEATVSADELLSRWDYSFQLAPYGAWAMLKRIGKAAEVSHRTEYELLLPIPRRELMVNPNLHQNPGYNSGYN